MAEELAINSFKLLLPAFAGIGIVYHSLALLNPANGRKIDGILAAEFGIKKRCVNWLEASRMNLHKRLIASRPYNMLAAISLIVTLILAARI